MRSSAKMLNKTMRLEAICNSNADIFIREVTLLLKLTALLPKSALGLALRDATYKACSHVKTDVFGVDNWCVEQSYVESVSEN